ncbi:hypothetical protein BDW69DRAFT_186730 [Aspergillus filifer]
MAGVFPSAGIRETPSRIKALFDTLKESSKRVRTKLSTVFRLRSRQNESTNETDCTYGTLCVQQALTSTRNGASGHPASVVANPPTVAVRVLSFPISTSPTSLSSSGRVPSDSIASTAIITSDHSGSGSWAGGPTGSRALFTADILVRGPDDSPKDDINVCALLDTGLEGYCLMASSHFDRLNKDGRITLEEPSNHESEGLHGSRKKARGIARALTWHFANGGKTFESDFLILDLDQYDVVISSGTIWEKKLLRVGRDLFEYFEESKRQQEADRALGRRLAAD